MPAVSTNAKQSCKGYCCESVKLLYADWKPSQKDSHVSRNHECLSEVRKCLWSKAALLTYLKDVVIEFVHLCIIEHHAGTAEQQVLKPSGIAMTWQMQ